MYIGSLDSKGVSCFWMEVIRAFTCRLKESDVHFHLTMRKDGFFILKIKSNLIFKNELFDFDVFDSSQYYLKVLRILSTNWKENYSDGELKVSGEFPDVKIQEEVEFDDLNERLKQICVHYPRIEVLLSDERGRHMQQSYHVFPEGLDYYWNQMATEKTLNFSFEIEGRFIEVFCAVYGSSVEMRSFVNHYETQKPGSFAKGVIKGILKGYKGFIEELNNPDFKFKKSFKNCLIILCRIKGEDFSFNGPTRTFCGLNEPKFEQNLVKILKNKTLDHLRQEEKHFNFFPFLKKSALSKVEVSFEKPTDD